MVTTTEYKYALRIFSIQMALEEYKNDYDGERIFILGNGPSLEQTPLNLLSEEYTFGVNNIANIFGQTDWRPSFYLAIHSPPDIPEKNVFKTIDLGIPCFFPEGKLDYVPDRDHIERLNIEHLHEKKDINVTDLEIDWDSIDDFHDVWPVDISEVVYQYTTILYPAIQISHYMGFSEIYLVGCDLYEEWDLHMVFDKGSDPAEYHSESDSKLRRVREFITASDYPVRSFVNGVAYHVFDSILFRKSQPFLMKMDKRFANPAHFYDTYDVGQFLAGNKLRNEKMIRSHQLAKYVSSKLDFDIYNATLGGSLEVYPRRNLYELLEVSGSVDTPHR